MLTVKPEKNPDVLKPLFAKNGVTYTEYSLAVIARADAEELGLCLFDVNAHLAMIRYLEPKTDLSLADGILRSAIHVALCNGATEAYYDNTAPEELFQKLKFIKNIDKKELNINKLFSSCQNCEKNE